MKRVHGVETLIVAVLFSGLAFSFSILPKTLSSRIASVARTSAPIEAPSVEESAPVENKLSAASSREKGLPETARGISTLLPVSEWGSQSLDSLPLLSSFRPTIPSPLSSAVVFWQEIYSQYDSNQVVLHDVEDLSIRYGVVDLGFLDSMEISEVRKEALQKARVKQAMAQVKASLDPVMADRLRTQSGLRDKFIEAIRVSGKYLPHFEEIFDLYGVPRELTRLAFVESMFQERARSRVGAAGVWQFMPGTGARYLRVSLHQDDRYDPLLASHAAARLLASNFESLGQWPLAITAYNTGVGLVQRGIRGVGSADISVILQNFRSSGFGFASRNFYPEFLAAYSVFENADRLFGPIERERPLQFDQVSLPVDLTFPQIALMSRTLLPDLARLNPSYSREVIQGHYALPRGSRIRIPQGTLKDFSVQLAENSVPFSK